MLLECHPYISILLKVEHTQFCLFQTYEIQTYLNDLTFPSSYIVYFSIGFASIASDTIYNLSSLSITKSKFSQKKRKKEEGDVIYRSR